MTRRRTGATSRASRARVLLAAVGLGAMLEMAACSMETTIDAERLTASRPLDPERFASDLRAIDRDMFTSGTPDAARRTRLSDRLKVLADRVAMAGDDTLGLHYAGELRLLARMVEQRGGRTAIEDGPLQEQWMRIRANLFDDASWLARSEADLHRPPPGPDPMLVAPEVVSGLRASLEELAGLARELPEELGRLTVEEAPAWQEIWRARLEPIAGRLPEDPPFPCNPFLVSAIRNAKEGLRMIERLPDAHRPWEGLERERWTEHYSDAERVLQEALRDLAKVETTS